MPTVPQTKATWTNNVDALDSTNLHAYLRDPLSFLMNKPAAELRSTSAQTIGTGSFTALTFNTEGLDDDPDGTGGHSTSSNTDRYTARYAGWYRVGGSVTWAGNTTGRRGTRWTVNGSVVAGSEQVQVATSTSGVGTHAASMMIFLNENDYLQLNAFQDSGGNLATSSSSNNYSRMTVEWVRLA